MKEDGAFPKRQVATDRKINDQEQIEGRERLRQRPIEGAGSGPAGRMDRGYFEELRKQIAERPKSKQ